MTLGEKIKKYRELRELTQRELGQKVGFSAGTEDSRIRKYEKNMNVESRMNAGFSQNVQKKYNNCSKSSC